MTWTERTTKLNHIRDRYHALDKVGGLKIRDSSLNLVQTLTEHQNKLTSELKEELNHTLNINFMEVVCNLNNMSELSYDERENIPPVHSANSMSSDNAIIQLLRSMEANISQLESNASNGGKGKSLATGTINPQNGEIFKRYCWTCGCCTYCGRV